jgi:alpha-glucosidase (family GH31 glycosyl hydrolase)
MTMKILALALAFCAAAQAEELGGYSEDAGKVELRADSGQRIRISAYGEHMVRIHAVRPGEEFFPDDRYEMVVPSNHAAMAAKLAVSESASALTLQSAGIKVVVTKSPLRIAFFDRASGRQLLGEDADHAMNWTADGVSESFAPAGSDEHFFGTGHGTFGRVAKLDLTGEAVSHNYDRQAPLIVPFYLSTRGYGVFFNTTYFTRFSFGKDGAYQFSASGGAPQLDYFVIQGPKFADIIDHYTELTGRPRLPQESIFGLQLSDKSFPSISTAAWWQEKILAHKAAGFPFDHQVNDNRWRAGAGDRCGGHAQLAFDPERWPDPAGYAAWAAQNGVTVTLDYNRCVSENSEGWKPSYNFAAADIAKVSDNLSVPDWSNPEVRAWIWKVFWDKALNPALKFPGDGLWLDEVDEMPSIPADAHTANGWRWAELANYYIFLLQKGLGQDGWGKAIAKRPWTWSRGALSGTQRFGHYWTGDTDSTYAEMRLQIRGMQASGLAGFPYFDHDAGGYQGATISDDLYQNWVAGFGAMAPIFRPHGRGDVMKQGKSASRWPLDQNEADQEVFRRFATLRYTLMPYIYSLAYQAHASGMPMARPMVLDYQDNPRAYDHDLQYLWGPSLLVMPVTEAEQSVWLPAGDQWFDYWDDSLHQGSDKADLKRATRTGQTLIFVRAGAILPRYAFATSVKEFDRTRLELDIYKGKDGSFTLYEDDGVTEKPAHSLTEISFEDRSNRLRISQPAGSYDGAPAARRYVVRLHGLKGRKVVTVTTPLTPVTQSIDMVIH